MVTSQKASKTLDKRPSGPTCRYMQGMQTQVCATSAPLIKRKVGAGRASVHMCEALVPPDAHQMASCVGSGARAPSSEAIRHGLVSSVS